MRTTLKMTVLSLTLLAAGCAPNDLSDDAGDGGGGGGGEPQGDPLPVDHAGATGTVTQNLRSNVEEIDLSLEFLEASDLLSEMLGMVGGDEDEGEAMGPDGDHVEGDDQEDPRVDIDLDGPLDDVLEVLEDRLLVESTVERDDDDLSVTYRLDPDLVCAEDEDQGPLHEVDDGGSEAGGDPNEEGDDGEDCRELLGKTPLRIRVNSFGEGDVDLTLLVGPDRLEVLLVQIHSDLLAVQIDLEALKDAAKLMLDEEDLEDVPGVVEGVLRAEIRRDAPKVFIAKVSILSDILITKDGEDPMSLRLGSTDSLVGATIDGANKEITVGLGIGEVDLTVPWQLVVDAFHSGDSVEEVEVCENVGDVENCRWEEREVEAEEPPQVEGPFNVFLAGLTGETTYAGDADRIKLTGLSLGDVQTTVKVDRKKIVGVDLNKGDGREVAVTLAQVEEGNMRIEVSPLFDVEVLFAMHHIEDVFDDLPDFLRDETLGVRLDGAQTPALQSIGGDDDRQLKVVEGELTFWSTAMEPDVVIGAGMCVAGGEDEDDHGEDAPPAGDPVDPDGGDANPGDGDSDDDGGHELFGELRSEVCGE